MFTEEEKCFMEIITKFPDDKTTKFAYADWLEEHNRIEESNLFKSSLLICLF